MRLEVRALIRMNYIRDTKARDELVKKNARNIHCLLIQQCVCLDVLGKVVNHSEYVPVTTLVRGSGPIRSIATRSKGAPV